MPMFDRYVSPADYYKIGIAENPKTRLSNMSSGTPHKLKLVTTIKADDAKGVESSLHSIYHLSKHKGEWYSLLPNAVNSLKALDRIDYNEIKAIQSDSATDIGVCGPSLYVEIMNRRDNDE